MTAEVGGEVLAVRYGTMQTSRSATFQRHEQDGEPDAALDGGGSAVLAAA